MANPFEKRATEYLPGTMRLFSPSSPGARSPRSSKSRPKKDASTTV